MGGDEQLANRVPARLSTAQGRKFGITVGIAFLVLATIGELRGRSVAAAVFACLGAAAVLAGLLIPRSLGPVERAWMGLAHLISRITTPIFMGVVYFLVITPAGLVRRALGKNSLRHASTSDSYWIAALPPSSMERQF